MRSVVVCTAHQILFQRSHKNGRWAEHVARTRERRDTCRVLVKHLMERYQLEDLGVDGRIILTL